MMIYHARRRELLERIVAQHQQIQGNIVIAAGYEDERHKFWQESTFWYLTGLHEPGAVLVISTEGKMSLYVPKYAGDRSAWMGAGIDDATSAAALGFDEILPLGKPLKQYQPSMWFTADTHQHLIAALGGATMFACLPHESEKYPVQRRFIDRLASLMPQRDRHCDISSYIADMRRMKSAEELMHMRAAIAITKKAHEAIAQAIGDGVHEAELAALVDYTFTRHGARAAFPSIIAGGERATILHYHDNNQILHDGDLVVVDIGASVHGYAADMSRTLPVSGVFTARQKELYDLVAHAQNMVFQHARPGMFINNVKDPERSLHHIAVNIFRAEKLDRYFMHNIGHFLGIDVHDVGNSAEQLRAGDVITIEPGLYIREEAIGIRIEDDYVITPHGAVCLSNDTLGL